MSRLNRVIRLDPYFDGERDQLADALPNDDAGVPATPPSRYGYQDAANFAVSTGTPMSGVMRPGPSGLRGTVIPKATMGGIPMGTRPHATRDLEVVIDPHIVGQSSRVRLGDVSIASVQVGVDEASEVTPEPYSIETMRLRGSAIMHSISQHGEKQAAQADAPFQPAPQHVPVQPGQPMQPQVVVQQPGPQYVSPPVPVAPQPQVVHQPMQQPVVPQAVQPVQPGQPIAPRRTVSPLSAFNQPPAEPPRELRQIDLRNEQTAESVAVTAPSIAVTFEVEHFGVNSAYYHDVLIQDGFVVLIYDNRYNGPKYFPQKAKIDNAPPMALNIAGTNEVYRVQTTGIQYIQGSLEHCVLLIEETGQLPPE